MSIKTKLETFLNPFENFAACCKAKTKSDRITQLSIGILKTLGYLLIAPAVIGGALLIGIHIYEGTLCSSKKMTEIKRKQPKTKIFTNEKRCQVLHDDSLAPRAFDKKQEFPKLGSLDSLINVQIVKAGNTDFNRKSYIAYDIYVKTYIKPGEYSEASVRIGYMKLEHGTGIFYVFKDKDSVSPLTIGEGDHDNIRKFALNAIKNSNLDSSLQVFSVNGTPNLKDLKEDDLKIQEHYYI